LGVACLNAGDFKSAITSVEKGIAVEKGDAICADWFLLSEAYELAGDHAQARHWFEHACRWMADHRPHDRELKNLRSHAARILSNSP
jgi:hypothetical protein